jgi:iron complex outermembrane receptor protein
VFCTVDRSGEKLPQLPKTQFGIGFTQDIPVSIGNLSLHADYSYRGDMVFTPITPASQLSAAAQVPYLRENELATVKGYGLVGARAALELDNGLEVSLFARNLLNKKYIQRSYNEIYRTLGIGINYLGEPRMYGVSMTYKFN